MNPSERTSPGWADDSGVEHGVAINTWLAAIWPEESPACAGMREERGTDEEGNTRLSGPSSPRPGMWFQGEGELIQSPSCEMSATYPYELTRARTAEPGSQARSDTAHPLSRDSGWRTLVSTRVWKSGSEMGEAETRAGEKRTRCETATRFGVRTRASWEPSASHAVERVGEARARSGSMWAEAWERKRLKGGRV